MLIRQDPDGKLLNFISQRNYDHAALNGTHLVNGVWYNEEVYSHAGQNSISPDAVNPLADSFTAVADYL